MNLDVGIHRVGFARKERFYALPLHLLVEAGERRLGLGDGGVVLLRLAEFDQRHAVVEIALEAAKVGERPLELLALAHHFLGGGRIAPEIRVLGAPVQTGEAGLRSLRVKDASSRGRGPLVWS